MTKKRAQRSETMIALRARRQAFTIANEIRNPHVDVGQSLCPECGIELHIVDSHEQHAVDCPNCGAHLNWPADFVAQAVALVEGNTRLFIEDSPSGAIFLCCMNCQAPQWFRAVDENYGVYCARCDHELVRPSDEHERRCAKVAFEQRKREIFYVVSGVIIISLIIAVSVVLILGLTRGI